MATQFGKTIKAACTPIAVRFVNQSRDGTGAVDFLQFFWRMNWGHFEFSGREEGGRKRIALFPFSRPKGSLPRKETKAKIGAGEGKTERNVGRSGGGERLPICNFFF